MINGTSMVVTSTIKFDDHYSDIYGQAVAGLLSIAVIIKLYKPGSELLVWKRGLPGGAAVYFLDATNFIRLMQMVLCLVTSALFFA